MCAALRIALLAHNHFPIREPFAGGLEAHIGHLAGALARHGHQVTLFAAAGSAPEVSHPGLSLIDLTCSPAAAQPFPRPGAVKESHHRAFVTLMAELIRDGGARFDVVHNHTLHYVPIMMAPRLATPMLTTLHTPPLPLLEAAVGAVRGMAYATVSRRAAAAWADAGASRIAVVPNGIDVERWPAGTGGAYLVWSGRLVPEKGPQLAIEAARRAGYRLVLAGPVVDRDFFRRRIAPHLGDGVSYAGHLDQRHLAALVGGAAAALATPLWDEPYGLVVAEAMACGTPVVAFARGGIPELLDESCGRLVAGGDVTAMAAAIPAAVALSRATVRRIAVERHGLDAMVAKYIALYRSLILRRRRPARTSVPRHTVSGLAHAE